MIDELESNQLEALMQEVPPLMPINDTEKENTELNEDEIEAAINRVQGGRRRSRTTRKRKRTRKHRK